MEGFIPVLAKRCNEKGILQADTFTESLLLNKDYIGAIVGRLVLLKAGEFVEIGGIFYREMTVEK